MTERRKFTTRERIGVITESGFSAEGLKLSGSPRAMRALEELISVLCDTVLGQREQIARVRELCEQTTVSVSIGCRCYTDECSGTCGAGRPLSWHLNPAAVLAALDGDSDE